MVNHKRIMRPNDYDLLYYHSGDIFTACLSANRFFHFGIFLEKMEYWKLYWKELEVLFRKQIIRICGVLGKQFTSYRSIWNWFRNWVCLRWSMLSQTGPRAFQLISGTPFKWNKSIHGSNPQNISYMKPKNETLLVACIPGYLKQIIIIKCERTIFLATLNVKHKF